MMNPVHTSSAALFFIIFIGVTLSDEQASGSFLRANEHDVLHRDLGDRKYASECNKNRHCKSDFCNLKDTPKGGRCDEKAFKNNEEAAGSLCYVAVHHCLDNHFCDFGVTGLSFLGTCQPKKSFKETCDDHDNCQSNFCNMMGAPKGGRCDQSKFKDDEKGVGSLCYVATHHCMPSQGHDCIGSTQTDAGICSPKPCSSDDVCTALGGPNLHCNHNSKCDVNPCNDVACPSDQQCIVSSSGNPYCDCAQDGYFKDATDTCVDPCVKDAVTCSEQNKECVAKASREGYVTSCQCTDGYYENPAGQCELACGSWPNTCKHPLVNCGCGGSQSTKMFWDHDNCHTCTRSDYGDVHCTSDSLLCENVFYGEKYGDNTPSRCVSGICVPICNRDSDCPDSRSCVNEVCMPQCVNLSAADGAISNVAICTNNPCQCSFPKTLRQEIIPGCYACVLPDYSQTLCTEPLDCQKPGSRCACTQAHFDPTAPNWAETWSCADNHYQCIPEEGAKDDFSCAADDGCASKNCQNGPPLDIQQSNDGQYIGVYDSLDYRCKPAGVYCGLDQSGTYMCN